MHSDELELSLFCECELFLSLAEIDSESMVYKSASGYRRAMKFQSERQKQKEQKMARKVAHRFNWVSERAREREGENVKV